MNVNWMYMIEPWQHDPFPWVEISPELDSGGLSPGNPELEEIPYIIIYIYTHHRDRYNRKWIQCIVQRITYLNIFEASKKSDVCFACKDPQHTKLNKNSIENVPSTRAINSGIGYFSFCPLLQLQLRLFAGGFLPLPHVHPDFSSCQRRRAPACGLLVPRHAERYRCFLVSLFVQNHCWLAAYFCM